VLACGYASAFLYLSQKKKIKEKAREEPGRKEPVAMLPRCACWRSLIRKFETGFKLLGLPVK
jgi:hypothetical protein